MNSNWTDELRKEVCDLWKTKSAAQIVTALNKRGHTFSRNAVIGVIHRSGLKTSAKTSIHPATTQSNGAPRGARVSVHTAQLNRTRAIALAPPVKPTPFVCADVANIIPLRLTLLELQDGDCRWPYDADPGASISHVFCGHPIIVGTPYCRGHVAIAFKAAERKATPHPAEFGKHRGGVFGRVA